MAGIVYIASMNMRGIWAPKPENTIAINVTSAQGKNNKNRRDFSPMTAVSGGYKGYYCFENYWQSGKVYEGIPIEISKQWWKDLKVPKRRYPSGKGRKIKYAIFDDEKLGYIESRKKYTYQNIII